MRRALILAVVLVAATACGSEAHTTDAPKTSRALVFTKTTGFRHDSIPDGVAATRRRGPKHGLAVDTTADAGKFTRSNLARYDVVIFLSTTGTPISSSAQQRAFETFVEGGGGFLGIHAASDTRGRWPWYE